MKILIIGGGIAGPALVTQLKKHNVVCDITLIEQAPEFKNIGYGIALWGNGRKILKEAGIDEHIIDKEGYEIPWEAFETTRRKLIKSFMFESLKSLGMPIFIPRALLHETIIKQLDPSIIRLNTKPVSIINDPQKKKVKVEFSDGFKEEYDLVVGADGIHSWTREHVFGPGLLKYYNRSLWVMWIDRKFTLSKGAVGIAGNGKLALLFPLKDKCMLSLYASRQSGIPDNIETRKRDLKDLFYEFGDTIRHMILSVPTGNDILFYDAAYVEMKEWHKGRVVLVGDAQHAMSPTMGMNASLALEDVCVLAQELANNINIDLALLAFSKRRNSRLKSYKMAVMAIEDLIMAEGLMARARELFVPIIPNALIIAPLRKLMEETA